MILRALAKVILAVPDEESLFIGWFLVGVLRGLLFGLGVVLALSLLSWTLARCARAEAIPTAAAQHRSALIRSARVSWGLNAPTSDLAAQVHQESRWDAAAVSPVGAQGLGQVMPATAAWLPSVRPEVGSPAPWNPGWSLRALTGYDRWLWERVAASAPCDRMAMTLSAYNGGLGWVQRDQARARAAGLDPARWWGHVETVNAGRSRAAIAENRNYPRRILRVLSPLYQHHGWGPGVCP